MCAQGVSPDAINHWYMNMEMKNDKDGIPGYLTVLDQNYKLCLDNRELKRRVEALKRFISKNDNIYNFELLKHVFSKLGNIFYKNLDGTVPKNILAQKKLGEGGPDLDDQYQRDGLGIDLVKEKEYSQAMTP